MVSVDVGDGRKRGKAATSREDVEEQWATESREGVRNVNGWIVGELIFATDWVRADLYRACYSRA